MVSAVVRLEDSRRAVADAVLEAMRRDGLSWAREWDGRWTPSNAVTRKPYRGINRVALAAAGARLDTPDGRWCTYSQAERQGWHVRRGERSPASVEFWTRWCRTHDGRVVDERRARDLVASGREDESILEGARLAPRVTPVFSANQVEGIPPLPDHGHAGEAQRAADSIEARLQPGIIKTGTQGGEDSMDDEMEHERAETKARERRERENLYSLT